MRASLDLDQLKIEPGQIFILKSEKYYNEKPIEYLKMDKNISAIKFSGVDTIEQAFRLVGYEVYIDALPATFSTNDYSGYVVRDTGNVDWGVVEDVDEEGMNKIIKTTLSGKTFLIPFATGIIVNIDDDKKVIVIDPPVGLRELNQ